MGVNYGSSQMFLPATDDGFEGPIEITDFPFGSSTQTQVFVSTTWAHEMEYPNFSFVCFVGRLGQMDSFLLGLGTTVSLIRPSPETLL